MYNRTVVQYAEEIIHIPLIHIELEIILKSWSLFRAVYSFFTLHCCVSIPDGTETVSYINTCLTLRAR